MSATSTDPSGRFGTRTVGVLLVLLGAFAVLGGLSTCSRQETPTTNQIPATKQEASMEMVVIPIEGMSCVACAARIKKTLTSIDGVRDVEVSLGKRSARVRFDPSRLPPERFVAAVNGLGYQAGAPAEARR